MNIQNFIQTTIAITNVLPSGTAFGVTARGESVFIPTGVAMKSNATVGDEVTAKLVVNTRGGERTPYMAIFIDQKDGEQPAPEVKAMPTPDDVYKVIEDGYMTTAEVADWLDIDSQAASALLNEMHKDGKLAKASVFAKPDQERASVILWARDLNGFTGE